MMAFVEVPLHVSILTALVAVWQVAAGALVRANGITKTTSPTTTTNVQLARYAVVTGTLENKKKVEVNIVIDLWLQTELCLTICVTEFSKQCLE